MNAKPVSVGIVGAGGWGKNLVRNYFQLDSAELRWVCDLDEDRRNASQSQFPATYATGDVEDLLKDPDLDGVVIATTAPSHHALGKRALEAGKDVYIEKPFTLSVRDARELIVLAEKKERVLMVGHLLEYHPVVVKLKEMIDEGYLGDIRYIYSQRLNLGTIRGDENAMWNFAPHDISIILYLLGMAPTDVAARGQSYLQPGIEDVVFMSINFGGQAMGHVHVSWLDPHKIRKLTIVGSKRMAVFDDLEANEKLKIYDKGAEVNTDYDSFAEYIGLRFGDITMPYIRTGEPLKIECEHFLSCIRDRSSPKSDGYDGLRVVDVLEAADRSLSNNGARNIERDRIVKDRAVVSLSLDLDNKWSYLKTHGSDAWREYPSYLDIVVPRILKFLADRDTKITFFIVGQDAALDKNLASLKMLAAEGHEIASHSFQHEPWLHLYSEQDLHEELEKAEQAIKKATGASVAGFRGPGFSISETTLRVLKQRGYRYDATAFPNILNPLARAYFFAKSNLTDEEKERRKGLFGSYSDAFRPVKPYRWSLGGDDLLELPVTTMPIFKVPIHFSYLIYLASFSTLAATTYLRFALTMCRITKTEPSLLLHPLDFLGGDDEPDLAFFPAMSMQADEKLALMARFFDIILKRFRAVTIGEHIARVVDDPGLKIFEPQFNVQ